MLKKIAWSTLLFSVFSILTTGLHAEEKILRRSNNTEPKSLYNAKADDVPSMYILRDLYEGLVLSDQQGKVIPGVAQKWEIDQTGTIYTFHLRQNAKWSNGDPVKAQDFVFGWQHVVDPQTASTYGVIMAPVKNAQEINHGKIKNLDELGIKALDDYTVQITLKSPTPYFLNALEHHAFYPFHKASYEQHKGEVAKPGRLVSNGAFQLEEWKPQEYILLSKNKHYWDVDKVKLDKVQFFTGEDQNTTIKNYRAGQLDLAVEVSPERLQLIKKDKNLLPDLKIHPWLSSYYYGINLTKEPLGKSKELREALSLVIDREMIVDKITAGGEIAAYGYVPPATANSKPQTVEFQKLSYPDRIKRAQELYKKAGYSKENPLKFEFTYNTDENHKKIAISIIDMWKKYLPGIQVSMRNMEWKVFLKERQERKNIEIFRGGWLGDYNDPYTFLEAFSPSAGKINDLGFDMSEYDELLKTASLTLDLEKRAEILGQAEKLLLETHAIIPILFKVLVNLAKPYIKGYEIGGNNILATFYSKDLDIVK